MSGRQSQQKLFEYLQSCEHKGVRFTKQQLIDAVGWKPATFATYYNKGQLTQFVNEVDDDLFDASNTLDLNFTEFKKRLSQSKHFQELGQWKKERLTVSRCSNPEAI